MRKLSFVLITTLLHLTVFSQDRISADAELKVNEILAEGDSLVNLKQYDTSIACYSKALDLAIDKPAILYKRGMAHFAKKDYIKAISDYTQVINIGSNQIKDAYFFRGMSKFALNDGTLDGCEDLLEAKKLDFVTDWEGLKAMCSNL